MFYKFAFAFIFVHADPTENKSDPNVAQLPQYKRK